MAASRNQIQVIQALRGIAAMLVMVYHKRMTMNTPSFAWGDFFFGRGAMGVDLFFIISGFIMVIVAPKWDARQNALRTGTDFFLKRVARVVPLYFIVTLLFNIVVWRGFSFLHNSATMERIEKSLLFIPLNASLPAPFYGYASLIVGWTLNYEMFFYLLFAIALCAGRFRYRLFLSAIFFLLVVFPLVTRGFVGLDAHTHYGYAMPSLNIITNPVMWNFVIGMLLAFWYIHGVPQVRKGWYFLSIAVFGILVLLHYFGFLIYGHGLTRWALPIAGLTGSLIFYEKKYGLQVPPVLIFLGKISYSIYILHPMVQYITLSIMLHNGLAAYINSVLYLLCSIVLTIGLATVTQKYIEIGLSDKIKNGLLKLNAALYR